MADSPGAVAARLLAIVHPVVQQVEVLLRVQPRHGRESHYHAALYISYGVSLMKYTGR